MSSLRVFCPLVLLSAAGCGLLSVTATPCLSDENCPPDLQCSVAADSGGHGVCEARTSADISFVDAGAFKASGPFVANATIFSANEGFNRIQVLVNSAKQLDEPPEDIFSVKLTSAPLNFSCGTYQAKAPDYTCSYTVTGAETQGAQTIVATHSENAADAGTATMQVALDFTTPTLSNVTPAASAAEAVGVNEYSAGSSNAKATVSFDVTLFPGASGTATAQIVPMSAPDSAGVAMSCAGLQAASPNVTCSYVLTGAEMTGPQTVLLTVTDQVGNVGVAATTIYFQ